MTEPATSTRSLPAARERTSEWLADELLRLSGFVGHSATHYGQVKNLMREAAAWIVSAECRAERLEQALQRIAGNEVHAVGGESGWGAWRAQQAIASAALAEEGGA